ncbi:hypothetical protein SeMB42_g03198 [Synchytrium endobioticum]|uniref:Uncharacterized protein n=1 Tax=Synchytrium endobioticum TaxID=286115 RepID=A0A507D865_9FUNG|nr:hypothetical protein SeLEV6574_g04499 [Synchytrium endobioticum]TPX47789.1 hypothetical protein SeMB42_g03198 [Synchytrium endobioticum]
MADKDKRPATATTNTIVECATTNAPDTASEWTFSDLCNLFQNLMNLTRRTTNTKGKRKKFTDIIKDFMRKWRITGGDFYPAIRLLNG